MANLTLSSDLDTLLQAANFAAARTSLGLGALSTVTPGTGVATALAINVGSAGAPVVLNGALGTPSSGTLTSATGLPISTGLTGAGTGVLTALAVNVGSAGAFVVLNGALGTPSSGTLTSATGLPISTGLTGAGTGVLTALAVNVGSAGAFVVLGGAGGTPSSLVLTNATGAVTATLVDAAVTLAKMANLAQDQFIGRTTASAGVPETATITAAARTVLDDTTVGAMVDTLGGSSATGTGGLARATSPTFVTPILGTPTSGTVTNLTGTASININGTVGATTPAAGTFTTVVAGSTTSILVGTAGSAVGNIGFRNATSGTATLAPPTGALGTYTVTLPNAASTLPIYAQQITYSGPSAARTVTYPDASFTVARTDAANTFTGASTATSWVFTTPVLGTPTSGTLTNCTIPIGGVTGLGAGVGTFLTTPSSANLLAAVTDETGSGALVFATSPTLVTPVLGTPSSGNVGSCTVDGTNLVGFRGAPQNSQSAAYTTVLADAGKSIFHPVGDNNARTFTIDSNANVAYVIGTIIEFINMAAASVTIAITSDTMTLLPAGTTGSRTLAQYGRASAEKITSTSWIISGNSVLT